VNDLSRRGFDPIRVRGPLQFFSLVAYVVSLAFLYAGMRALPIGPPEIAWTLIVGALLLVIGITAAIFMTMRKYHWTYFHPSEITEEYAIAVRSLSATGKLPPEVTDQRIREFFLDIAKDTQRYSNRVLAEILDSLTATGQISSGPQTNLTGGWKGIVDGSDQIIEIEQRGPIVFLNGTVLDDAGTVAYTFEGEGRIILGVLVFSWRAGYASGTNIMTISPKGDVLEGKYFNQFGAYGYERYERADEKNSESP
jgi:hypothetical protein